MYRISKECHLSVLLVNSYFFAFIVPVFWQYFTHYIKVRPADHMRPAKHYNVSHEHFSGSQNKYLVFKRAKSLLFCKISSSIIHFNCFPIFTYAGSYRPNLFPKWSAKQKDPCAILKHLQNKTARWQDNGKKWQLHPLPISLETYDLLFLFYFSVIWTHKKNSYKIDFFSSNREKSKRVIRTKLVLSSLMWNLFK